MYKRIGGVGEKFVIINILISEHKSELVVRVAAVALDVKFTIVKPTQRKIVYQISDRNFILGSTDFGPHNLHSSYAFDRIYSLKYDPYVEIKKQTSR